MKMIMIQKAKSNNNNTSNNDDNNKSVSNDNSDKITIEVMFY